MGKQRRHFTSADKIKALRRHLVEKVPISDLCEELGAFVHIFRDHERRGLKYISPAERTILEEYILVSLDSKHGPLKVYAMDAVKILNITRAKDNLLRIARLDDQYYYRVLALRALAKVGDASCVPILAEIAKKDDFINQWGLYRNREQAWQTIKTLKSEEKI